MAAEARRTAATPSLPSCRSMVAWARSQCPTRLPSAPSAAQPAAEDLTVDDVLVEARRNNRVCPLPAIWQRLYAYLPNTGPHLAKVPATHAEWSKVPPLQKRARLREHIEWAASQGVLRQGYEALKKLPENRWHHIGE